VDSGGGCTRGHLALLASETCTWEPVISPTDHCVPNGGTLLHGRRNMDWVVSESLVA
jgi:hypothetical protein